MSNHTKATTLSLYWGNDSSKYKKEAKKVKHFFQEYFNYEGHDFSIPLENSQEVLKDKITRFLNQYGTTGSLVVIHYAGCGGEDVEDNRRRSRFYPTLWPHLEWDEIQPLFKQSKAADILILFNCCYYLVQKASTNDHPGHKAQVLAACVKYETVPGPDRFTGVLMEQAKILLRKKGYVSIPKLHKRMSDENAGLQETPIFFNLLDNPEKTALVLTPLRSQTQNSQSSRTDSTALLSGNNSHKPPKKLEIYQGLNSLPHPAVVSSSRSYRDETRRHDRRSTGHVTSASRSIEVSNHHRFIVESRRVIDGYDENGNPYRLQSRSTMQTPPRHHR